jgi:60 kDa SS-A/Ro ribonucleoprotein
MPIKKSSTKKSGKKPSAAASAMASQAAQSALVRAAVPQWFRLDPDQVPNNAGGFVWQISDQEQVLRYLIIGSEGGNYYQTPQQVSSQCASCVLRMTRTPANFKWLVDTIREVSMDGRAAKQESTLLALATAIVFARTPAEKSQALAIVNDCVRILTHMYMLIGYIKIFSKAGHPNLASASASASAAPASAVVGSGIGRGIRRVFGEYFYSRTGIEVANLVTKYQNREGWTIKDVLTLIHIDPKKMKDDGGRLAIDHVFGRYVAPQPHASPSSIEGTTPSMRDTTAALFNAIKEIHTIAERPLKPATNPSLTGSASGSASNYQYGEELDRIVHLINTAGLCREQLPSQLFKYRKVWEALLLSKGANGKGKGMPLTALIRNLGKLSTPEIGIIDPKYISAMFIASSASSAYSTNTQWGGVPPTEYIIRRITDAHDIKRTRIHPYTILVAMLTYQKGQGDKGSLVWSPNSNVIKALDKAFKLAFQNITPTGKRIKIALDVSGSMSSAYCTGSPVVTCATGSVAMMMMTGFRPRTADSNAPLAAPSRKPAQEPAVSGPAPPWTTTQLPDGRTLYENTETNQCQFTPPPPAPAPAARPAAAVRVRPPTVDEYRKTKQYLGLPITPAEAPKANPGQYYSSYYTPPPPSQYHPELYPPLATPSKVTICAFSNTLIDITNAIIGYMDATADPATGLPTMTIADALKLVEMPFSSTDCALPMIHALKNKEQVDAFVIYTDSETYMGTIHPQAALEEYRKGTGIDAKLIVVGMTSNCLTIADPKDLNTLNLAGFDTATPRIISDFIRGVAPPNGAAMLHKPVVGGEPPNGGVEEDQDEFVMLNPED